MRNLFVGSMLVAAALAVPAGTSAQQAGMPDLSGMWSRAAATNASGIHPDDANGTPFLGFTKDAPPLTPEALENYRANRQGVSDARAKGRDDRDPLAFCFPPGPTRIFTEPRPFEIRQIPEMAYILSEIDHVVRRIQTEGEKFDGYPPTWHGYSVGHYDGDTLVAETIEINEQSWLDSLGTPHSDALQLTERFRRANRNTLEIEFTFEDPKAFTRPWGGKKLYQLQPASFEMPDHVLCEDFRKEGLRRSGFEFFLE